MPGNGLRPITSYKKAIKALGGTSKAAEAIGTTPSQICKWRARHQAFPAEFYPLVQEELERRGYRAENKVFTFEVRRRAG